MPLWCSLCLFQKPVQATMTMDANDVPIRRAVKSPPVASVRGLGLLNLGRVGWVGRGKFLFSYCRIEKDSVACRDAKIDSVRVNRRRWWSGEPKWVSWQECGSCDTSGKSISFQNRISSSPFRIARRCRLLLAQFYFSATRGGEVERILTRCIIRVHFWATFNSNESNRVNASFYPFFRMA